MQYQNKKGQDAPKEFLTLSFYLRDFSRVLEITPSVFIEKLSRVLSGNGPFT
jgi:hypothetical protein